MRLGAFCATLVSKSEFVGRHIVLHSTFITSTAVICLVKVSVAMISQVSQTHSANHPSPLQASRSFLLFVLATLLYISCITGELLSIGLPHPSPQSSLIH